MALLIINTGGDVPVGCRRTAQRGERGIVGFGGFVCEAAGAARALLYILRAELLLVDRKISWGAGFGNLTEMRVSRAFSTLPQRGFWSSPADRFRRSRHTSGAGEGGFASKAWEYEQ